MAVFQPEAGDTVEIDSFTTRVLPKCHDTLATGHWTCIDHNEDFPHNWAAMSHLENGDHTMAWYCRKHGIEVP
jgi:hypothetical protein